MPFGPDNFLHRLNDLITGDDGFIVDRPASARQVSAAESTDPLLADFVVPRDYDQHSDECRLKLFASMEGATDEPSLTVTVTRVREGEDDETLVNAENVGAATEDLVTFDLNLDALDLQPDDMLAISVTPGAHTADDLYLHSIVASHRSTLVAYDSGHRNF